MTSNIGLQIDDKTFTLRETSAAAAKAAADRAEAAAETLSGSVAQIATNTQDITALKEDTDDLKSALKYSKLKSGYLSTAISVSARSTHSSRVDRMDCDLKQENRYFFSILNSEGVVATEMRAFYSDGTDDVIRRTAEGDNVVFEQLIPTKDIVGIGMYISNGGQNTSVTRISVWDTAQIPQDYYQNEHAYIKSNGYVIRKDADNGASEITISDSIIVICGTQIIVKSKADMLNEITGSVESGNGVKFTLDPNNALVYNYESNALIIRYIPAVRPSEITLLFAHHNGIATGLLINKYLKKLIDDDHTTVTGLDTRISNVEDIITGDINKTVVATIPAGAQSGVWVALSGNARAVRVSCESDVITGYRIWTDAIAGSYITAEVNKIYYVDTLRNDNYQIQIPVANMKKEGGAVIGGTATFTWAYQSDILLPDNSVEGRSLVDKSISVSKLSNEAVEAVWESGFSAPLEETYVDTEVSSVQERLDSIQTENTSSIGFITDLHYYAYDDADDSNTRPFMRIARSLRLIDAKNMIDFIVFGGDYLWNNQNTTRARAEYAYKALQRSVLPLREKVFALKGNHDDNSLAYQGGQPVTAVVLPAEEYRYLGKQYEKCGTVYNPGDHNIYGYYDIPSQKIRCIFVNTGDLPYNISGDTLDYGAQHITAIRQEQSEFIQEALRFNEAGWSVLFFSHHGLINCDVTGADSENYCADLWEIIKAYKNRTTYSGTVTNEVGSYNVNVDYSANLSNEIIACICGHVHADKSDIVDDILIVSTTCACPGMISHQIETADETSYDIFTVDRSNGKLYATRYGLGNDREWTYQS